MSLLKQPINLKNIYYMSEETSCSAFI